VAVAVQALRKERKRIDVVIAAGTTDLTGKDCSPYGAHLINVIETIQGKDASHPEAGEGCSLA
jgi:hypothetical protein